MLDLNSITRRNHILVKYEKLQLLRRCTSPKGQNIAHKPDSPHLKCMLERTVKWRSERGPQAELAK